MNLKFKPERVVLQFQKTVNERAKFIVNLQSPLKNIVSMQIEEVTLFGLAVDGSNTPVTRLMGIDFGLPKSIYCRSNKVVSGVDAATTVTDNNLTGAWYMTIPTATAGAYQLMYQNPESRELTEITSKNESNELQHFEVIFVDETIGNNATRYAPQFTQAYLILTFYCADNLEVQGQGPRNARADVEHHIQGKSDALNFIGYNL